MKPERTVEPICEDCHGTEFKVKNTVINVNFSNDNFNPHQYGELVVTLQCRDCQMLTRVIIKNVVYQ